MAEEYLQAAFEIKTMCDELSRRVLRWHWEKQAGKTLPQLADYTARRARQVPELFGRLPAVSAKGGWQQLDTTLCMRVLLDTGEGDDEPPLRLLSAARRPVGARHTCNGLRVARNAAAHATTLQDAAEAAAGFAETVEDLADHYGDTVFTAAELEKYRRAAARAVKACADAGPAKPAAAKEKKTAEKPVQRTSRANAGQKAAAAPKTAVSAPKAQAGHSRAKTARSAASKRRAAARRKKQPLGTVEKIFLMLGGIVLAAALYLRAVALGLLSG